MNHEKSRRRTPGRAQKLIGDIYLLVGRVDLAAKYYSGAIEICKNNGDWQWQAAAIEGHIATQLLLMTGSLDGVISNLTQAQEITNGIPSNKDILKLSRLDAALKKYVIDLPEKYREVVALYDRAYSPSTPGYYPILQHQACFKIALFLSTAYLCHCEYVFTNRPRTTPWILETKSLGAEFAAAARNVGVNGPNQAMLSSQHTSLELESDDAIEGVSQVDVLSWLTHAWMKNSDYLTLKDQVKNLATISAICGTVGLARKHAFYLRLAGIAAHATSTKAGLKSPKNVSPALFCLENAFEIYAGSRDRFHHPWVQDFANEWTAETAQPLITVLGPRITFGWPQLQIAILRECVVIAQENGDFNSTVHYISSMLRSFYWYLSISEQFDIFEILRKALMLTKGDEAYVPTQSQSQNNLTSNEDASARSLVDMLIVRSIKFIPPKSEFVNNLNKAIEKGDHARDVFLYNPYAKSKTAQAVHRLVVGELCTFEVTIANPFLITVDIQQLKLM